jgi:hypothetical protein
MMRLVAQLMASYWQLISRPSNTELEAGQEAVHRPHASVPPL